jgi:hypothetical protein
MTLLAKVLPILCTLIAGTIAILPTSYDVAWTTPGVNGSADSMPLGGGDIGINTWFEDGKLLVFSTHFYVLGCCTLLHQSCREYLESSYV